MSKPESDDLPSDEAWATLLAVHDGIDALIHEMTFGPLRRAKRGDRIHICRWDCPEHHPAPTT